VSSTHQICLISADTLRSVFFCAELLGLPVPQKTNEENPFTSLLEILLGDIQGQEGVRNKLGKHSTKYRNAKKNDVELSIKASALIKIAHGSPKCLRTLESCHKVFQSHLLQLNIQPRINLAKKLG